MLRFVLRRAHKDVESGADWWDFETIDLDVPQLEEILKRGGFGPTGHDLTRLAGAEILKP